MRTALILVGFFSVSLFSMIAQTEARPSRTRQVGPASWYGPYHHGRPTASGERFSTRRLALERPGVGRVRVEVVQRASIRPRSVAAGPPWMSRTALPRLVRRD
jgi:rare lipoprotein A (peptidoglycan hydrolase)